MKNPTTSSLFKNGEFMVKNDHVKQMVHVFEEYDEKPQSARIGDLYLKLKSIRLWQLCTLNVCSVCFCQYASKHTHQNGHEILCTDDTITAMNEAVNIDSVNKHHQI